MTEPRTRPPESAAALPAREIAAAAVLLVAALALRLLGVFQIRFNSDEAQHAHLIWGWTRGLVQYRDYFDNHTPLFHLLWAPLAAALGESVSTLFWLRLSMLPLYAIALVLTFVLGRRLFSLRTALWGTVLTALLPPFFLKTLELRTDVLWTVCWLGAAVALCGGPPSGRRGLAAGLLLGAAAAVSLKTTLLVAALAGGALLGLAYGPRGGGERGGRARAGLLAAGSLLAGMLVVPLVVAAYFQARGALGAMLAGAVGHNLLAGPAGAAASHGKGWLARTLTFALGLAPLLAAAPWVRRSGRPGAADRRLLLFLTCGVYLLALLAFWPLVTSQSYLPIEPFLVLVLAGAFLERGAAVAGLSRTAVVFLTLGLAAELAINLYKGPLRGDATRPQTALVAAALRLTGPDEPVFDLKGETVFRRRAFFPVLEDITRSAMAAGRIADTIPEDLLASGTCVAVPDSPRLPPRGRAFLDANFILVSPLRVCGQLLPQPPPRAGAAVEFTVRLPARYLLVGRGGAAARGRLDGAALDGARFIAAGKHRFEPDSPPPWALLWARAAERGFSPF
ncbi:MAG TPA: hypothetical protein VHR45_13540 [Thermoanaerobaculia bacterium]|nr:hypothetical protein [Thermoanaerobaculia bacterium]